MNEISLGTMNRLRVVRRVDFGYYLQGTVRGQIVDVLLPNGEVTGDGEDIKGAKVTAKCEECGKVLETVTDFLGDFEFQGLPTNKPVTVTVEAAGYKPAVLTCRTAGSVNFGEIALEK